jgi:type II secretory pathway pseudopilin PulG
LIEILLAIGILAILATATIIAINPARQFAEARNTQRWNDVHAITNAVYQYSVAHKGKLPIEIPLPGEPLVEICIPEAIACPTIVGIPSLTDNGIYLRAIPVDPSCPDACMEYETGYSITTTPQGRIHVISDYAELGETIEVIQ